MMGKFSFILTLLLAVSTGTLGATEVPPDILVQFEDSFTYDDENNLVGAEIEMLKPFLSDEEKIISLFANYGQMDPNNIYIGYKPKRRGTSCKLNPRWICTLRGVKPGVGLEE